MRDRGTRRRKREKNPYAELIHTLNKKYHGEWQRAELLQNELTGLRSSKIARAAEWFRRVLRGIFPHPATKPKFVIEKATRYQGTTSAVPDAHVSVIIPFRDQPELLRNCLRSLRRSTYPLQIVLVDNGSEEPRTARLLSRLRTREDVRILSRSEPFNFARLCNAGAKAATGDHLLFLNNDTEVLTRDWVEQMLKLAADAAVGAVGATLLYPDYTIQHAGMLPRSDDMWIHPYRGESADVEGEEGELRFVRVVPAVTAACMLVRRDVFDAINGFDEQYAVTLNDVDLCRRIRARGQLVVVTPHARLLHYEGLSRGYTVDPALGNHS